MTNSVDGLRHLFAQSIYNKLIQQQCILLHRKKGSLPATRSRRSRVMWSLSLPSPALHNLVYPHSFSEYDRIMYMIQNHLRYYMYYISLISAQSPQMQEQSSRIPHANEGPSAALHHRQYCNHQSSSRPGAAVRRK